MTTRMQWDPFQDLRNAQDEMAQAALVHRMLAHSLGQGGHQQGVAASGTHAWAPALDISERKDAYVVAVDLPGVSIDDVEITFQDGLLTIQGERHDAHDSSEEKVHRVERRFGPFLRSITLPSHIEADAIEASAKDGVLQILMPKAAEVHAKRIQVVASQKPADPAPAIEGETSN